MIRTIIMQRQNAGWVKRTGWQAVSLGQFHFDGIHGTNKWTNAIHPGAFAGAFNVRNIRDQPGIINTTTGFQFRKVLFDADLGLDPSLNVLNGGFSAPIPGVSNPPVLTPSRDLVGWVQILPVGQIPDPATMQELIAKGGPFTPAVACSVEAGQSSSIPGTILRASAFEVDMIASTNTGAPVPVLGVALRGAPQIPRGGGWSLGQRILRSCSFGSAQRFSHALGPACRRY